MMMISRTLLNLNSYNNYNITELSKLYGLWDITKISFWNIVCYIIITLFITTIMVILSETLSLTILRNKAQLSEYECGFEPFDNATRAPFEIHFYVVGILFLIFDVEIALLYPWIFAMNIFCWSKFFLGYFFLLILGIGFGYELKMHVLDWKHNVPDNNYIMNTIPTNSSKILNKNLVTNTFKMKAIFLFNKSKTSSSYYYNLGNIQKDNFYHMKCRMYRTLVGNSAFLNKTFQNSSKVFPSNYWNIGGIGGGVHHNVWWNNPNNMQDLKKPVHKFTIPECKVDAYYKELSRGEKINLNEKPTFKSCWCVKCQSRYVLHGEKE